MVIIKIEYVCNHVILSQYFNILRIICTSREVILCFQKITCKTIRKKPLTDKPLSSQDASLLSLSKDEKDDSDDCEFDSIFNEVTSASQPQPTKQPAFVTSRKHDISSQNKKPIKTNANPKPSSQGLLVTCTNNTVIARNIQLLSNNSQDTSDGVNHDMIVTAIGQPIIVAEELGEVTSLDLSHDGQWLALALGNGCHQVWIIQLTWKQVQHFQNNNDGRPNQSSTSMTSSPPIAPITSNSNQNNCHLPQIIKAVRHHATLDGHKAPIHGLHFLKGKR